MSEELTLEQSKQRLIGAVCATFGPNALDNSAKRVNALLEYAFDLLNANPGLVDQIPTELWQRLSTFSKVLLVDSALVNTLHASHSHPNYEYESVVSGRKQGDGEPPKGNGWETNWLFDSDGLRYQDHDRDDHTDTAWWRRLKEDAKFDEVDPFDHGRPKITLEPINLHFVLLALTRRLNSGYFPIPKKPDQTITNSYSDKLIDETLAQMHAHSSSLTTINRPEFNSKPNYIESSSFLNGLESGVNKFQPRDFLSFPDEWPLITKEGNTLVKCNNESLYAFIEMKDTDILIDLNNPFQNSFVRVNLKGVDKRGPFKRWVHFATLPINPFVLEEAIQLSF